MFPLFRRCRGLVPRMAIAVALLWTAYTLLGGGGRSRHDHAQYDISVVDSRMHPRQVVNVNLSHEDKDVPHQPVTPDPSEHQPPPPVKMSEQTPTRARPTSPRELLEMETLEPEQLQIDVPGNADRPGEQGKPVKIDKEKLSPAERQRYDEGWKNNAYNEFASEMISLHRALPDDREEECKKAVYRPLSELPTTSVVVIFHNEGWTVLLRTIHSIIDHSPPQLLKEIILVDDCSTMAHLGKPLEDYVSSLPKVKILRALLREGLIRARLMGAAAATADMLVFLDSHCECAAGWLEPLADRIADSWSNVLTPVIEVINYEDFSYSTSKARNIQVGGFNWDLTFTWHMPTAEDRGGGTNKSAIAPIRSPTMAGGLFAISKKYFEHLGTYDPGMDIWGAENLELSFRVWMCGGRLETIPCSHIGHIFRQRMPYSWKTASGVGNVLLRNNLRLAEVWMDDFKKYYYTRLGEHYSKTDFGDVSSRRAIRERLQCKDFSWFVDNIYPTVWIPGNAIATGEIRNAARPLCVDNPVDKAHNSKPVHMVTCHGHGGNQNWYLSKDGEIRRDDTCLDFAHDTKSVINYPCHGGKGNQEWTYTQEGLLRHRATSLCLELRDDVTDAWMRPCDVTNRRQQWLWRRRASDRDRRAAGLPPDPL